MNYRRASALCCQDDARLRERKTPRLLTSWRRGARQPSHLRPVFERGLTSPTSGRGGRRVNLATDAGASVSITARKEGDGRAAPGDGVGDRVVPSVGRRRCEPGIKGAVRYERHRNSSPLLSCVLSSLRLVCTEQEPCHLSTSNI